MTQGSTDRALAEVERLRALMGELGLNPPLPDDASGDASGEASEREDAERIASIVGLPAARPGEDVDGPGATVAPGATRARGRRGRAARGPAAPGAPRRPVRRGAGPTRARRPGARPVAVAATALLIAALAIIPTWRAPQAEATNAPPMLGYPVAPALAASSEALPARDELLALADVAGAQDDASLGTGPVQHVLAQGWLLAVDGDDGAAVIEPTVAESWLGADGSFLSTERRGPALGLDGRLVEVRGVSRMDQGDALPAGTFDASRTASLPRDPAALRQALLERLTGVDCEGPAASVCLYLAVTDLWDRDVVPADLTAAMWRVLADEPGLTTLGDVTDRAGRDSLAVAFPVVDADADPVVRIALIDTTTGRLSGREEVTLESPALDLTEPTVTQFRYVVDAGRVAELGAEASED